MFGYIVLEQCKFPNMSIAHDVLMAHLMRPLMFCPYINRGWAPRLSLFTILQSSLPIANFFLLCFYELFFERNYQRSLTTYNFLVSFFFFQTSLHPLLCFLWLCLLGIIWLEKFCFFLRLRTSFTSGVSVIMLQAGYKVFVGLESSH